MKGHPHSRPADTEKGEGAPPSWNHFLRGTRGGNQPSGIELAMNPNANEEPEHARLRQLTAIVRQAAALWQQRQQQQQDHGVQSQQGGDGNLEEGPLHGRPPPSGNSASSNRIMALKINKAGT